MILAPTLAKLAEQKAVVYRVDWPMLAIGCAVIEAHSEHFATYRAATRAKERYNAAKGVIVSVAADDVPPGAW